MGLQRVSVTVVGAMLVASCVEPQPQTLTLPTAADQDKKVRQAMVEFNEARFEEECAAIDSAIAKTGLPADTLPGGVLLQRDITAPRMQEGLKGWQASPGDRVQWAWEAYTLGGSLLTSGSDEFEVERGAVPRAFHEAAKSLGHDVEADVWSPSVSTFGVRGVPGEIPPFTPVRLHVRQTRSVRDTAWWGGVQRGVLNEAFWLKNVVQSMEGQGQPIELGTGVWAQVHSEHSKPREVDETVLLRIRTATLDASMERETQMEWKVGTQDQLVPALEKALSSMPTAQTLTVWCTSAMAFGRDGSPEAGIAPHTSLRFEVEVVL
ncbi:MAG: FKBP-type peptidyl-prolyl cis-trans isomerase [Flavobacteriales bacterium]